MTDDMRLDATPGYRAEDAERQEAAARWQRYREERRADEVRAREVALAAWLAALTPIDHPAFRTAVSEAFRAGFDARSDWA